MVDGTDVVGDLYLQSDRMSLATSTVLRIGCALVLRQRSEVAR
jgi:hypothetical protein